MYVDYKVFSCYCSTNKYLILSMELILCIDCSILVKEKSSSIHISPDLVNKGKCLK